MQPSKPPPPPRRSTPGSSASLPAVSSGAMRVVPPPPPLRRFHVLPWVCLGVSLGLFAIVGVLIARHFTSGRGNSDSLADATPAILDQPSSANQTDDSNSVTNQSIAANSVASAPQMEALGASEMVAGQNVADPSTSDVGSPSRAETQPPRSFPNSVSTAGDPTAEIPAAFADLHRRNLQLELPGRGTLRDATDARLAAIPLVAGESLQLAIPSAFAAGIKLVRQADADESTPTWTAVKQARDAFGGQEQVTLGQFIHRDGELHFHWDTGAPGWAKPGSLQFVPLELKIGAHQKICHLWRPIDVNPTRITTQSASTVDIPLPGSVIDHPERFRIQYQIAGSAQSDLPAATVRFNEAAKVLVGDSENEGVELELKLVLGDAKSSLQMRLFGSPPVTGKDGEVRFVRQEISPAVVQNHVRQGRLKDPKKRQAEIDKLQTQSANLQKLITQKEGLLNTAAFAAQMQLQLEIQSLTKQAESVDAKVSKLEADLAVMQDYSDKNAAWCEKTGAILKNLDDLAQLRYAVYMDTEPRTVVIETSGFDW